MEKSIFSRTFAVDLDGKSCNRWIISDPADSTNFHRVFGCKSPLNSTEKKSCIGVRANEFPNTRTSAPCSLYNSMPRLLCFKFISLNQLQVCLPDYVALHTASHLPFPVFTLKFSTRNFRFAGRRLCSSSRGFVEKWRHFAGHKQSKH